MNNFIFYFNRKIATPIRRYMLSLIQNSVSVLRWDNEYKRAGEIMF